MTMPSSRAPGGRDDPYGERRARIQLCAALADFIPEQDNISIIIAYSGLREAAIPMEASPVTRWTALLAHAVDEGKMDALLNEILAIHPETGLAAAVQVYRSARES
jgi:hypothetical protein